jgi:D-aspartate ligase
MAVHSRIGAIVVGGHFHGLGLIRLLSREGVDVVLIDHEPCLARFSRYPAAFFRCPDLRRDEQGFIRFLIGLVEDKDLNGWVIFPTDDETVRVFSRYRGLLSRRLRVSTAPWSSVRFAYDKRLTYQLAAKIGIPIPRTFYPENAADLDGLRIRFPVLVKPAVMREFFLATGRKAFRARDMEALKRQYRLACSVAESRNLLIQEEIPEVWNHLYSYCPFIENGRIRGKLVAKRERQHPMDLGHASTYVVSVELPELEALGNRFLRAIGYEGLCEIEFVRDLRDRRFKLLEMNPRIWGWHSLSGRAGVNLPYLAFRHQIGRAINAEKPRIGVKWFRMITDIPTAAEAIFKRQLGLRTYLRSLKGEKEFSVFSWNDPWPALAECFMLPYLWLKRGF